MGRQRLYQTPADRQKAYRARLSEERGHAKKAPSKPRRLPSRPSRLTRLTAEVQTLTSEYEHWLSVLPEPLQDSDIATRLAETVEQLTMVIDLLTDIHPPRGFGRD